MQDIINTDNAIAMQTSFNIPFDTKNMANFYAMGCSSLLAHHHSKKCQNLTIKDVINSR